MDIGSGGEQTAVAWRDIFGNANPVEVEIGPERGTFLIAMARLHPERNYFGIERSATRARRMAAALENAGLQNVRVINADAAYVISTCVPLASVSAYHVYFPDPWWKRRHQRRRLFAADFTRALERTLAGGGVIHLVTDVQETFMLAVEAIETATILVPQPPQARPVRTAFEIKARRRGSEIYEVTFHKAPGIRQRAPGEKAGGDLIHAAFRRG